MNADDQQHAHVVVDLVSADPQALWNPSTGGETLAVVERALDDEETRSLALAQARGILARCTDPGSGLSVPRTGLVIGYVQSGKTLSFTALTALARDNGYPLVILLAGTKITLHEQTVERLQQDLRAEREDGMSPWSLMSNPEPTSEVAKELATRLNTMLDPSTPSEFKRTTVITVMKNTNRLGKVAELLNKLSAHGVPTSTLPVLVIDDEADQAGMNAGKSKEGVKQRTPTYESILSLRDVVPNSSYVMYTATPQAPLLISLVDALSPDYVNVLTPGPGYTGGSYFFGERKASFVKTMSPQEVTEALDASGSQPPETLEQAIATFFLLKVIISNERIVSMLVHPSRGTELHTLYGGYVRQLVSGWSSLLAVEGPDRAELIETYFEPAYEDLVEHADREIAELSILMNDVRHWMNQTQIRVINSDPVNNSELNWRSAPSWIVIGGNKLDRGFTIEGLAITYMPRGVGVGNADTIQQRARFFGYKRSYGDLCRAWLAPALSSAYEYYVEHEEHLREQLKEVERSGATLKSWTRKMLLDASFKATRRAVIELPFLHSNLRGESWIAIDRIGRLGELADVNRDRFTAFVTKNGSDPEPDERDPRDDKHRRLTVPLGSLLSDILVDWQGHPADRVLVQQVALVLRAHLDEDPTLLADVYLMDNLRPRERALSADALSVSNLQQGRAPNGPYPGDKAFYTDERFSLQVHNVVNKRETSDWAALGLTLRIPTSLAGSALVQFEDA